MTGTITVAPITKIATATTAATYAPRQNTTCARISASPTPPCPRSQCRGRSPAPQCGTRTRAVRIAAVPTHTHTHTRVTAQCFEPTAHCGRTRSQLITTLQKTNTRAAQHNTHICTRGTSQHRTCRSRHMDSADTKSCRSSSCSTKKNGTHLNTRPRQNPTMASSDEPNPSRHYRLLQAARDSRKTLG